MKRKSDVELDEVVRLLANGPRGRSRRSPLFRWLNARAGAFQTMLHDMQPTWQAVAEALAAQGLVDGAGKPPTAERARQTWLKVRQMQQRRGEALPQSEAQIQLPSPPPTGPTPQPAAAVVAPAAVSDVRARLREKFKPVSINRS